MFQDAIRAIATKYSLFVTDEMVTDMNNILMEVVSATGVGEVAASRVDELTTRVEALGVTIVDNERRIADLVESRNRYSRDLDAARERAHEFAKDLVDDHDFDRDDANTFLESIGANRLMSTWTVDLDWGYTTLAQATVQADTEEQAESLVGDAWETESSMIVVTLNLTDTDEVSWDRSTAEHETEWDDDVSDHINYDVNEDD